MTAIRPEGSDIETRRPGRLLLMLGLALGILGDLTLRGWPWGIGVTVSATTVVGLVAWLQLRHQPRAGVGRVAYAVAALAIGAGFGWRDAGVLKALDLLALAVSLGLLASERADLQGGSSLAGYGLRVSGTAAHAALGTPLLVAQDVDWSGFRLGPLFRNLMAVTRGLVLTVPAVVAFTALLVKADPVFDLRVREVLDVDILAGLDHLALVFAFGWIGAGFLRAAVLRERPAHRFPTRPDSFTIGRIEIALVLGSLDLLFGAFVWIQLRYLFGGTAWVRRVVGLTYAEYARSGFFELVAVTALVLPLLLTAHWLLRPESQVEIRMFAVLAGTQVLLVLVMLASALERMRLYREEYGLTELRFYTTAFMGWLGTLLVWFALTVTRGRRAAFAQGVLVSGFAALVLLHLADPEEWIVRANGALARSFDVSYALGLGADAAPALIETARVLDPGRANALARGLLTRWVDATEEDWPMWSLSRARARRLVGEAQVELRVMARAEPPALP